MNSYFASVEQQANPFLRGKPVGVCAYMGRNGAVIASSIEAKEYGVRVTRSCEAKKLCPGIVLVQNDPAKYRSVTREIFSIFAEYTDQLEPYSIDESFLDLTGYAKTLNEAISIGNKIKERIKNEVGVWLRSSVGVSHTRFLAKLQSDNQGVDGISKLTLEDIPSFLDTLTLTDICGINYRLEKRLHELDIYTPNELRQYPVENMLIALGKFGYYLHANLNGESVERVVSQRNSLPKSIGHSYCLPRKTNNIDWLAGIFMKLCERTGRRLRAKELEAHGISVSVGYVDAPSYHTRVKVGHPLYTTAEIFDEGWSRLVQSQKLKVKSHRGDDTRVNFLAVSVFSLRSMSDQGSLFCCHKRTLQDLPLQHALDTVNDKFGDFTVYPGNMMGTEKNAPDRIGYRKTVGIES